MSVTLDQYHIEMLIDIGCEIGSFSNKQVSLLKQLVGCSLWRGEKKISFVGIEANSRSMNQFFTDQIIIMMRRSKVFRYFFRANNFHLKWSVNDKISYQRCAFYSFKIQISSKVLHSLFEQYLVWCELWST